MRSLIALLVACSSQPKPSPPISSRVAAKRVEAVMVPPLHDAISAACPLSWDELAEYARPRIALRPWTSQSDAELDECPPGFDAEAACPDCAQGAMGDGQRATLHLDGPAGSGRFVTLGLVVGSRFTCMMASTVGWRHLYPVAAQLAPLPWLADVDRDGARELVVWHRLPWGHSESENALYPIVYELDGNELVRRDDRARAVLARVGGAYRTLAERANDREPEDIACYRALAHVMTPR